MTDTLNPAENSHDNPGTFTRHMIPGGSFILDQPTEVPAIWGNAGEVLWSEGEACILAGPPGVGKTTLVGQVIRGLLDLTDQVLGYSVKPASGRVLYLAMDRPKQIARSLGRHFTETEREILNERLVIWPGPPPADIAENPELIKWLASAAGASHVILDSLKDAAVGLSEDKVGAGYNRARQTALAAGVEVMELHHTRKHGSNGAAPTELGDLYGSTWISAGAGSVILLWGAAGDPIVDLTHLKQPSEPVGPLKVIHDHAAGTSTVLQETDPLAVVEAAKDVGVTAQHLAKMIFSTEDPSRNEAEKARRLLAKLQKQGLITAEQGGSPESGGKAQTVFKAITRAITHPVSGQAITLTESNHDPSIVAGQAITPPITAITHPTNHDTPLVCKTREGSGDRETQPNNNKICTVCLEPRIPIGGSTTHPNCEETT